MKIKKYFAKDMRKALNMAREEHGPDVVILSNRKVMGGVELLAAEDYDVEQFKPDHSDHLEPAEIPNAKSHATQKIQRETSTDVEVNISQGQRSEGLWTQDSVLERMQDEIHSLRKLLEQQMSGLAWGQIGRSHPVWAGLLRRYALMGVSPVIAKSLVEQIPKNMDIEKAWRMSLAFFSYRITTLNDDILTPGNVLTFLGSSGVGKTTTIAKLATKLAMQGKVDNIVFATTDSYRIGGRDHLRSYANILGLPVYTLHNSVEIKQFIDKYQRENIIFIDTAGLNPRDQNYQEQLEIISGESHRIKTCQVLSANTPPKINSVLAQQNNATEIQPDFAILTKLDEADSIGRLLSFVAEKAIPVAYVSEGQKVPDDLHKAEAHKLISNAASRFKQYKSPVAEEELEQVFGKYAVAEPFGE